MPERLELTKNAQFYVPKTSIEDSVINDILGAAVDNMDAGAQFVVDLFRSDKRVEESELDYKCSVRVFPSVRPVYFINEALEDRVYAFIILIEYQNYLAIFKKSCANISELIKEHFALIDSRDLTRTFGDNDVEFQKIALRNMTISDRAMRARSYEAADLKGLLSTHSAGRSIPFYLKLRQGAITKTISGTGRLVESSQRKSLDEIAVWVKEQVELIESPSNDNNFLDAFAKKVELSDVLSACEPNAILVESTPLQERIDRDGMTLKYKTARAGNVIGGGDWSEDRLVPDCIKSWSRKKKVILRNPKSTRPWQHVLDVLNGYIKLAINLSKNNKINGEAFNFGPKIEKNFPSSTTKSTFLTAVKSSKCFERFFIAKMLFI